MGNSCSNVHAEATPQLQPIARSHTHIEQLTSETKFARASHTRYNSLTNGGNSANILRPASIVVPLNKEPPLSTHNQLHVTTHVGGVGDHSNLRSGHSMSSGTVTTTMHTGPGIGPLDTVIDLSETDCSHLPLGGNGNCRSNSSVSASVSASKSTHHRESPSIYRQRGNMQTTSLQSHSHYPPHPTSFQLHPPPPLSSSVLMSNQIGSFASDQYLARQIELDMESLLSCPPQVLSLTSAAASTTSATSHNPSLRMRFASEPSPCFTPLPSPYLPYHNTFTIHPVTGLLTPVPTSASTATYQAPSYHPRSTRLPPPLDVKTMRAVAGILTEIDRMQLDDIGCQREYRTVPSAQSNQNQAASLSSASPYSSALAPTPPTTPLLLQQHPPSSSTDDSTPSRSAREPLAETVAYRLALLQAKSSWSSRSKGHHRRYMSENEMVTAPRSPPDHSASPSFTPSPSPTSILHYLRQANGSHQSADQSTSIPSSPISIDQRHPMAYHTPTHARGFVEFTNLITPSQHHAQHHTTNPNSPQPMVDPPHSSISTPCFDAAALLPPAVSLQATTHTNNNNAAVVVVPSVQAASAVETSDGCIVMREPPSTTTSLLRIPTADASDRRTPRVGSMGSPLTTSICFAAHPNAISLTPVIQSHNQTTKG